MKVSNCCSALVKKTIQVIHPFLPLNKSGELFNKATFYNQTTDVKTGPYRALTSQVPFTCNRSAQESLFLAQ